MAPLPANNTDRLFVDYITGNIATAQEHTVSIRFRPAATAETAQNSLLTLLTTIGAINFRSGWRLLGARFQPLGSDFAVPVPLITGLASFVGTATGTWSASNEALEWKWVGRDYTHGRKVNFSLYGLNLTQPENFRLPSGGTSPAWVAGTVFNLNTFVDTFCSISGDRPTWYSYVNAQFNSYWEDRLRG